MKELFDGAKATMWHWLTLPASNELASMLQFFTWCFLLFMLLNIAKNIVNIIRLVRCVFPKAEQEGRTYTNEELAEQKHGQVAPGCKIYFINKKTGECISIEPRYLLEHEYDHNNLIMVEAMNLRQALRKSRIQIELHESRRED